MEKKLSSELKKQNNLLKSFDQTKVNEYKRDLDLYSLIQELYVQNSSSNNNEKNSDFISRFEYYEETIVNNISEKYKNDPDFYLYALYLYHSEELFPPILFNAMSDTLKNNKDFARNIYAIGYYFFKGYHYNDETALAGGIYGDMITYFNELVTMDKDVCDFVVNHDAFGFAYSNMRYFNLSDKSPKFNEEVVNNDDYLADALIKYNKYVQENEPSEIMQSIIDRKFVNRIADLISEKTKGKEKALVRTIKNLK